MSELSRLGRGYPANRASLGGECRVFAYLINQEGLGIIVCRVNVDSGYRSYSDNAG